MNKEYFYDICKPYTDLNIVDQYLSDKNEFEKIEAYSSILLLLGGIDEFKEYKSYERIIQVYVSKIKNILENYGYSYNQLYGGITGVGFAILAVSDQGKKYSKLISSINNIIIYEVKNKLKIAMNNLNDVREVYYDAISGLAGDVAYLLYFKDNNEIKDLIIEVIKYFIMLTEDIKINDSYVPRFFIKSDNAFTERDKLISEYGYINQGLAHGIPSILNILSLSLKNGIEIENQKIAMEKILDILCKYKYETTNNIWWYDHISFENFVKEELSEFKSRESWCYGTPGIARSIYIAGDILGNEFYKNIALKALKGVASSNKESWGLDSSTLCHGYSSILSVMNVMYKDTRNELFKECIEKSQKYILNDSINDYIFRFKDLTYLDVYNNNYELVYKEDLSLLSGATGVILTLYSSIKEDGDNYLERMLLID